MIDEKKITEAVNAYIGYPHEVDDGTSVSLQRKAFRAGAEWFKQSLWHDANEEPIMGARVLINHHLIVITWHNEYKWDACCKLFGITKWAYIDDLLPKQFGNSEQLKGGEE